MLWLLAPVSRSVYRHVGRIAGRAGRYYACFTAYCRGCGASPCHKRLTYLVCEHNASDALWIPEQLVHIIVTNDVIMITSSPHKLSINGLIA